MGKSDAPLPKGRLGRARRAGFLGLGSGTRLAMTNARTLGRSADRKDEVWREFHRRTAEQMRLVLGEMKGASMKLGQIMSFVDSGMIPPEYAELYHDVLADLRDSAPPMPFETVAAVVEDDTGRRLTETFAAFDEEPSAAASIGQVHSARLHDGRRVVVKVQYPGVDVAMAADVKNAAGFVWLAPLVAPGLDAGPLFEEMKSSLLAELDYEAEGRHQRRFAAAYRDHPFVVVPEPVSELCGRRVLVAEEVRGASFDEMLERPERERDRAGEIIFRFAYGTLYRFGFFNADTHPGNYAFLDDGRVAFYDFGAVKVVQPGIWVQWLRLVRGFLRGDAEGLFADCVETGFVRRPDKVAPERLLEWLRWGPGGLIAEDAAVTVDNERVGEIIRTASDPREDWYALTRWLNMERDAVLIGRMQVGVLAVLAKLRATANWHRIAREWVFEAPPATPLGAADAAYFAEE